MSVAHACQACCHTQLACFECLLGIGNQVLNLCLPSLECDHWCKDQSDFGLQVQAAENCRQAFPFAHWLHQEDTVRLVQRRRHAAVYTAQGDAVHLTNPVHTSSSSQRRSSLSFAGVRSCNISVSCEGVSHSQAVS